MIRRCAAFRPGSRTPGGGPLQEDVRVGQGSSLFTQEPRERRGRGPAARGRIRYGGHAGRSHMPRTMRLPCQRLPHMESLRPSSRVCVDLGQRCSRWRSTLGGQARGSHRGCRRPDAPGGFGRARRAARSLENPRSFPGPGRRTALRGRVACSGIALRRPQPWHARHRGSDSRSCRSPASAPNLEAL